MLGPRKMSGNTAQPLTRKNWSKTGRQSKYPYLASDAFSEGAEEFSDMNTPGEATSTKLSTFQSPEGLHVADKTLGPSELVQAITPLEELVALQYKIMEDQASKIPDVPIPWISPGKRPSSGLAGNENINDLAASFDAIEGQAQSGASPSGKLSGKRTAEDTELLDDSSTKRQRGRPVKLFGSSDGRQLESTDNLDTPQGASLDSGAGKDANRRKERKRRVRNSQPSIADEDGPTGLKGGSTSKGNRQSILAAEFLVPKQPKRKRGKPLKLNTAIENGDTIKTPMRSGRAQSESIYNPPSEDEDEGNWSLKQAENTPSMRKLAPKELTNTPLAGPTQTSPKPSRTSRSIVDDWPAYETVEYPQKNNGWDPVAARLAAVKGIPIAKFFSSTGGEECSPRADDVRSQCGFSMNKGSFVNEENGPSKGVEMPAEGICKATPFEPDSLAAESSDEDDSAVQLALEVAAVAEAATHNSNTEGMDQEVDNGLPSYLAEPTRVPEAIINGVNHEFYHRLLQLQEGSPDCIQAVKQLEELHAFLRSRARKLGINIPAAYDDSADGSFGITAQDKVNILTSHVWVCNGKKCLRFESWRKTRQQRFRGVPVLGNYRSTWGDIKKLHDRCNGKAKAVTKMVDKLARSPTANGEAEQNALNPGQDAPQTEALPNLNHNNPPFDNPTSDNSTSEAQQSTAFTTPEDSMSDSDTDMEGDPKQPVPDVASPEILQEDKENRAAAWAQDKQNRLLAIEFAKQQRDGDELRMQTPQSIEEDNMSESRTPESPAPPQEHTPPPDEPVKVQNRQPYVYKRKRAPNTAPSVSEFLHESSMSELRAAWANPSTSTGYITSQIAELQIKREDLTASLSVLLQEYKTTNDDFTARLATLTGGAFSEDSMQSMREIIRERTLYNESSSAKQLEMNQNVLVLDGEVKLLEARRQTAEELDGRSGGTAKDDSREPSSLTARLEQSVAGDSIGAQMARSLFEWARSEEQAAMIAKPMETKKRKKPLRKKMGW